MAVMKKSDATELLGNSATAAAEAIGITPQAYNQWPEILPARLRDRVQAALARKLNVLPPQATDASVDRQLSPEQVQP